MKTVKPSILLVIDGLQFGGGERVFLQMIDGLKNRFDLHVATFPHGRLHALVINSEVHYHELDLTRKYSLKPVAKLHSIIIKNRIDIIHSQGVRSDFFCRIAGKFSGVPVVCTLTMRVEGFDVGPVRKLIYRFLDRVTRTCVRRFIVVSKALQQTLIQKDGIPSEKVVLIYNGIEVSRFGADFEKASVLSELGLSSEGPIVAAVGRMVWQKGFIHLIRAVPIILNRIPMAMFIMVGEGPEKETLEAVCAEFNLAEKVIFTGFRTDINAIMSAVDLLVVPSLAEGFPMVTLEAMSMTLPVVASDIDGINEQIKDRQEGILVPPADHHSLASAIIDVLEDKQLAETIRIAAREKVVRDFSVETMIAKTEKVYRSLARSN